MHGRNVCVCWLKLHFVHAECFCSWLPVRLRLLEVSQAFKYFMLVVCVCVCFNNHCAYLKWLTLCFPYPN